MRDQADRVLAARMARRRGVGSGFGAMALLAFNFGGSHGLRAETGLEALTATRERPLFSPTRRPPPPPPALEAAVAPPAAAPLVPPPQLILSGIVFGSQQMAIVKHAQDPAATSLRLGSAIDGWIVSAIDPRAIVLRRDTRSVTIELQSPR
jgi:general secretion pathway protein N